MKTIQTFSDGGKMIEVAGVQIIAGRAGQVSWMSDWTKALELVAANVLTRSVWRGNGMYGHDTFTLN